MKFKALLLSLFFLSFVSFNGTRYRFSNLTNSAGFFGCDGAQGIYFRDSFWVMGGWNPNDPTHFPLITTAGVRNSADGVNYTSIGLLLDEPRHFFGLHVWNDTTLVLVGGDAVQGNYQPTIQISHNGRSWQTIAANVYCLNRYGMISTVINNKLYISGGQTRTDQVGGTVDTVWNDTWVATLSDSPLVITRASATASWTPRGIIGNGIDNPPDSCIYIIGGAIHGRGSLSAKRYRGVYKSCDGGVTYDSIGSIPKAVAWHNVVYWDNKFWCIAGANISDQNQTNIYYSNDAIIWDELYQIWGARHASTVITTPNSMHIGVGNYLIGTTFIPDFWKIQKL